MSNDDAIERKREKKNVKQFKSDINSAFETLEREPREPKDPYTRSFGRHAPFFRNLDKELGIKESGRQSSTSTERASPEVPLQRQNTPELGGPELDIDFNPIKRGVTPDIERSLSQQKEQIEAIRKKMIMAGIKPRSESAPPSSKTGGTRKSRKRKTQKRKKKKSLFKNKNTWKTLSHAYLKSPKVSKTAKRRKKRKTKKRRRKQKNNTRRRR